MDNNTAFSRLDFVTRFLPGELHSAGFYYLAMEIVLLPMIVINLPKFYTYSRGQS